jgi:ribonucleotide reductase alpha subunit
MNTQPVDRPANHQDLMIPRETKTMLLYENLARERMREAEQDAATQRLVRRLNAAKRWERLAAWAARRAERAQELL